MKRQDVFLIGCLVSSLSFLYFESSSFDFQPITSLSSRTLSKENTPKDPSIEAKLPPMTKNKVVEMEVATVE